MITAEMTPREIVTRLHVLIAAQSPEHAALVAEYEAIPREQRPRSQVPRPPSARMRQVQAYTMLRLSEASQKAAARMAGISPRAAERYEAGLIAVLGGDWS